MKKTVILWGLLSLSMAARVNSQDLQGAFCQSGFYCQAEGPFVETYLKLLGPSANYAKTTHGTYQASLEVTLLFIKEDKIIDYRKYNLQSSELDDTLNVKPNFIDQQRVLLPSGTYRIDLTIKDNNNENNLIENSYPLDLEFNDSVLKFSGIQLIESFQSTKKQNILSKSGFDLLPYVGDFYPVSVNKLTFYTELYNLGKKIGENQDFLYRYYIESFETKVMLGDYSGFQRQKAAMINPIMATMPIAELPGGNYNLVVEARDRNNELILQNKLFFQRDNPGAQINLADIQSVDITSTFAEQVTTLDSLKFYIQSLKPISTQQENRFIDKVIETTDQLKMQKFLFNFWKIRNEQNPEAEWTFYKDQVLAIEKNYATRIKHGYETDMGYVWLKYGTPNQVEDSKSEPNSAPYIIWTFYHINNQSNVRFVFYDPHVIGTEYFLVYSDARDDRYNANMLSSSDPRANSTWQSLMYGKGGSGWGSRFLSNFKR